MSWLVFLLEEPSAAEMLKGILPNIVSEEVNVKFLVFEGKQDLEKQLERRLKGWQQPNSVFLVMRDKDGGDCLMIKQRLAEKVYASGKQAVTLIRIACTELESFYLGDLNAVGQGLEIVNLEKRQQERKYRTPDTLPYAAQELSKLTQRKYQKVAGSRAIAPFLKIDGSNKSHSFNVLLDQYKTNPEDFIAKATRLINEQKATVIVEHLAYDAISETHSLDIFTKEKPRMDFNKAGEKLNHHIYDYVFTDSNIERNFVKELDTSKDVVVYAKLPRGFFIPTPVGDYNPDWAISFKEGAVKHIYFIAETKGSMSSMELREIEQCKIKSAKKFFSKITSGQVKYDVVDNYGKLMELVK